MASDWQREGETYRVRVTGHGDREAVWLGRVPAADVQVGDFTGILFAGGLAYHVVRVDEIKPASDQITFVFDWNGYREKVAGGTLLADDVTQAADDRFREVWRPADNPAAPAGKPDGAGETE